jgi:hypothetical protein
VGWDGEGRERKGEEGRDGKRAGGKYCFMAVGGDGRHWPYKKDSAILKNLAL